MTDDNEYDNYSVDQNSPTYGDPITDAVVGNIMAQIPVKKPKVSLCCNVCNLEFSSQIPLDMHLKGSKHAKRVKSQEILENLKDDAEGFDDHISSNGSFFRCEVCSVVVNSSQQLQTHLAGNKHKQKLLKRSAPSSDCPISAKLPKQDVDQRQTNSNGTCQESETLLPGIQELPQAMNKVTKFYCDTCQLSLNSNIQLQQHVASSKHLDKVMGKDKPKPKRYFASRGKKAASAQPMFQGQRERTPVFRGPHLEDSFVVGDPMIWVGRFKFFLFYFFRIKVI